MNDRLLFVPAMAQILLTLYAYLALGRAKQRAAQAGLVNEARRALHDDAWPSSVLQINNNIRNQFELPVLFYALLFVLWALSAVGVFTHVLAWLFVASRVVHFGVHTGSNRVSLRRQAFGFGVVVIGMLWVVALVAVLRDGA